jgi:ankyrin repeat protein
MMTARLQLNTVDDVLNLMATLPEFLVRPGVASRSREGNTPLKVAAVWGDVRALQLLLDAGAGIDDRNEHGFTALHHAAAQGYAAAVRLLLERGADAAIRNDDGLTAGQCATDPAVASLLNDRDR